MASQPNARRVCSALMVAMPRHSSSTALLMGCQEIGHPPSSCWRAAKQGRKHRLRRSAAEAMGESEALQKPRMAPDEILRAFDPFTQHVLIMPPAAIETRGKGATIRASLAARKSLGASAREFGRSH